MLEVQQPPAPGGTTCAKEDMRPRGGDKQLPLGLLAGAWGLLCLDYVFLSDLKPFLLIVPSM